MIWSYFVLEVEVSSQDEGDTVYRQTDWLGQFLSQYSK